MEKKEAFEVVLALIASGRLPMPSFDVQNQENWAVEVKKCVAQYVMLLETSQPKIEK